MSGIYEQLFENSDRPRTARWLRLLLFMLAYLLLATGAMILSHDNVAVVPPWLAGPMAIGALIRLHPRDWIMPLVGIALADMLAHYIVHTSIAYTSIGHASHGVIQYTVISMAEIVIGALWLRWRHADTLIMAPVSSFMSILVISVFVIPLIGSLALVLTSPWYGSETLHLWWGRYISGALGMLVMLPVTLKSSIQRWRMLLSHNVLTAFNAMLALTIMVDAFIVLFFPDEIVLSIIPLLLGALLLDFFRSTLLNAVSVVSLVVLVSIYQQNEISRFGMFHYISIALTVLPALLLGIALQGFRRERSQLLQSEQRWKAALEGSGQGVWEMDLARGQIRASLEAHCLQGEGGSMTCSIAHWREKTHPDDVAHVEQALEAHITGKSPRYVAEYRVRQKDGSYRWYQSRGRIMRLDEQGKALQIMGTLIDIHAARQAEIERERLAGDLQEEKERLQVTLNSIGDGVIATDMSGTVVFMNPVAEEITGWPFSEARHRALQDVFHLHGPDMTPRSLELIETCLTRNEVCMTGDDSILINKDQRPLEVKATAAPVRAAAGRAMGAILVFQDMSRARELQRRLTFTASHDALTGLYNRRYFEQEVENIISQGGGSAAVLVVLNLDHFKIINDSAGQLAGDALLIEIARLIEQHLGVHDVLARLGSDEFAVLLHERDIEASAVWVDDVISTISALRFSWNGQIYEVSVSAGLIVVDGDAEGFGALISHVNVACYTSKRGGRNRATIYHSGQEDIEQYHRDIFMAGGLREAIDNDRFTLFFQRIAPLQDEGSDYLEILVRMLGREGEIIAPGAFIPVAERYGIMAAVDRWVIKRALVRDGEQLAQVLNGRSLSINLSANSLNETDFLPWLLDTMAASPLSPQALIFEITETALMNHLDMAREVIDTLRRAGCRVALDDFGSGLSSFSYLRNFEVDIIKIDGGFIRHVNDNALDQVIVDAINQIAHRLGALTVAEFIEDAASQDRLTGMGVDYAQGYYIHRPMPLEDLWLD
ncbi:PAS domain S-box-containing protein/diguanylate cyclase (GGDEF) domain-containing protein [Kushneria avicenniae]|uniref:PAS domain S-box-containing protein/diguanylate cyclase (GGDEF) domain-containing protein n=1 Tax=Kushneria avicenniae TaxID=402385 RepID=A0A1I1LUN8_9GAMM|nr:EAL domain-containing protein [Kushneria avicenniae]SFC76844.1 PAS domain S-box-containing protein/diguanylate cyclase (GGDEF) domain-containing protein [Kushneria avicenniae]